MFFHHVVDDYTAVMSFEVKLLSYQCQAHADQQAENDIVLLKHRTNTSAPIITEKLQPGKTVPLTGDSLRTDDIIGKSFREVVGSRKRVLYRIHQPSLAEYTDNSPRLVTPVWLVPIFPLPDSYHITVDLLPRCKPDRLSSRPQSHIPLPKFCR